LTAIEGLREVPFNIARVFYVYDVAAAATRARHGHRTLEQFVIAVSGSFTLTVRDPDRSKRFDLRRGFEGVYIPPMLWVDLEDFSTGAVALVLASASFDPSDYFDEYDEYAASYELTFGRSRETAETPRLV
jgi:hypothetical protein